MLSNDTVVLFGLIPGSWGVCSLITDRLQCCYNRFTSPASYLESFINANTGIYAVSCNQVFYTASLVASGLSSPRELINVIQAFCFDHYSVTCL